MAGQSGNLSGRIKYIVDRSKVFKYTPDKPKLQVIPTSIFKDPTRINQKTNDIYEISKLQEKQLLKFLIVKYIFTRDDGEISTKELKTAHLIFANIPVQLTQDQIRQLGIFNQKQIDLAFCKNYIEKLEIDANTLTEVLTEITPFIHKKVHKQLFKTIKQINIDLNQY